MTNEEPAAMPDARATVAAHLDAVNAHDTERLLALFAEDVEWITGRDRFAGRAGLAELFDSGLWALEPSLTVVRMIANGTTVAAQLREQLTVAGEPRDFAIAAFFDVRDGLIRRAKVYREGSADID